MRFLCERLKLVVEPSGATGIAALLSGQVAVPAGPA
jgi:threonine dehydratase